MSDNDNKIKHLVEQALSGNKTSMENLMDHFYNDVFRMVYYRLPTRMDAEDLTQEVFMQMTKSLPNLKDSSLFKPWLFRIALNRVRDFHRKKSILSFFRSTAEKDVDASVNTDSYSDPSKNIMNKEFRMQLRKFSENLSRWEREVFALRFLDQLEIKEIVQIVQKNENTVKTHLYRALKKFRGNRELYSLLLGE